MIAGSAVISDDALYRYRLTRTVSNALGGMTFIMLNPSTADATKDDATIRRCIGFCKSYGVSQLNVVNLFAFRATSPTDLFKAVDPVGPDNDRHIMECCRHGGPVICAWGVHGGYRGRDKIVLKMLRNELVEPKCYGTSKHGFPRHPLYLPKDAELRAFSDHPNEGLTK